MKNFCESCLIDCEWRGDVVFATTATSCLRATNTACARAKSLCRTIRRGGERMKYERLTKETVGSFGYDLKDFEHKPKEFNDYDAFYAYKMAVKRLGELEDKIESGESTTLPTETRKSPD